MDIKYLKQVALGFLSVVLVLSIFSYVIYHMTNGFTPEIKTTPALIGEYFEQEKARGYIFREETPLVSGYSGTVSYSVNNGEKAGAGAEVARVYDRAGDERLTAELVSIDKKTELLRASNISDNVSVSGTSSVDKKINEYLSHVFESRRSGNYSSASSISPSLLVSMNRRELIVTSRTSYNDIIDRLSSRKQELSLKLSGANESITLKQSGYFYYACDGYESIFTPSILENIKPTELEALASAEPDTQRYIGKSVTSSKWYLALNLDRTEMSSYNIGESYKIGFDGYIGLYVSMKLEYTATEAETGVLVFSSLDMPEGFGFERVQNVSIIKAEYEGLRFPMSAVRINEGVEGVFVLYGNTVFFRRAEVIGKENGYAVVRIEKDGETEEEAESPWAPLALYDEVIVSGTGLYHTMIVN